MKKILGLLGLACRAGKTSSGTMAAKSSLMSRRACLLVMSEDISTAGKDSLLSLCRRFNIPWITMGDKYQLGNAVGKAYRVAVTVNDPNMTEAILNISREMEESKSMGVDEWQK